MWRSWMRVGAIAAFWALCPAVFAKQTLKKWVRVSTPDLTIITSLSDRYAAQRSAEFTQYIRALRRYFGEPDGPLPPLTMVIFDSDPDFMVWRPLGIDGKPKAVGGFFCREHSWSVIGLPPVFGAEDRRTIFHEAVHWYLSASGRQLPPWLDEGLAEVFSTFEIGNGDLRWGRQIDEHLQVLEGGLRLPVRKLVQMEHEDLFTHRWNDKTQAFYAEAWLFMHYLIFGENGLPRDAWRTYTRQVLTGTDPAAAFVSAFGCRYEEMDRRLSRYLSAGKYRISRRHLEKIPPAQAEPASSLEVDEALGRLAYVGDRFDAANAEARSMIERDPKDPRGHALLALALEKKGDRPGAFQQFKLAVEHGSKDSVPYFEAAIGIQNGGALPIPESGPRFSIFPEANSLSPAEARQAADCYRRAIEIQPRFEEAYTNLAGLIGVAEPARDTDRSTLQAGGRLFPANQAIQLGLAQIAWHAGDHAGARATLGAVAAKVADPSGTTARYVRSIQENWSDEEFFAQVGQFQEEKHYAEALALIDRRLADGEPRMRLQLANLRINIQLGIWEKALNKALESRQWATARHVISAVLESGAPPSAKANVKRILASLDDQDLRNDPPELEASVKGGK